MILRSSPPIRLDNKSAFPSGSRFSTEALKLPSTFRFERGVHTADVRKGALLGFENLTTFKQMDHLM